VKFIANRSRNSGSASKLSHLRGTAGRSLMADLDVSDSQ